LWQSIVALVMIVVALALLAGYLGRRSLSAVLFALMILVNIASAETVHVFGLAVTVGTPLYAVTFMINNMISERYGKRAAQAAIFSGFCILGAFSIMGIALVGPWFSPLDRGGALASVLSSSLRILLASLVTFLVCQQTDVVVYHVVRRATQERMLWARGGISATLAEALDSLMFFFLAFVGTGASWWDLAVGGFVVKSIVGVLLLPAQYLARRIGSRDLF
jgi:uncharacterized integral membrane protein (TIGR00697 family)